MNVGSGLRGNTDFVKLTAGETVSSMGSSMASFALPLLALVVTGSPARAGLVSGFAVAGSVAVTLFAGALVDRWPRRPVLLTSSALRAVAWASIPVVALMGHLGLWQLIVVGFVNSAAASFFGPAEAAAVKAIVPTRLLPAALSVNEGRQSAAGLIGAPVAGLLWAVSHLLPFGANAVSFLASLLGIASIRHRLGRPTQSGRRHLLATMGEGLRFVWRQRAIRYIYLVASLVNFALTGFLLAIVLHLQQQNTPTVLIGLLETASGAGALVGAVVAARALHRWAIGALAVTVGWVLVLAFGLIAAVTVASTRLLPVAIVVLFAAMILTGPLNAGLGAYSVAITPDGFQGRVNSVALLMTTGLTPLSSAGAGVGLEYLGLFPTLVIGLVLILACALTMTISRDIRQIPHAAKVDAA